jgi:hypothetical protein
MDDEVEDDGGGTVVARDIGVTVTAGDGTVTSTVVSTKASAFPETVRIVGETCTSLPSSD